MQGTSRGGRLDWDTIAVFGERVVTYSVRFWLIFALTSTAAITTYLLIYRAIVPDASHVKSLHFAFEDGLPPTAYVQLGEPIMAPGQAYAFGLSLEMPECAPNRDAGNFMVHVTFHTARNASVLESHRPAILRYRSSLVRQLWTVAFLPFLLLGRTEEKQTLRIALVDEFSNPHKEPIAWARVRLSKPELQLYSASIHVDAIFRGLSYYMHTHRLATAVISISSIVLVQFVLIAMLQFRGRGAEALAAAVPRAGDADLSSSRGGGSPQRASATSGSGDARRRQR